MIRKQTKLWTTKDGQRIRLCDMSDSHLINAIKIIERRAKLEYNETMYFYKTFCPFPTDTIAEIMFYQAQEEILENTWEDYIDEDSIYHNMIDELNRRNLSIPE